MHIVFAASALCGVAGWYAPDPYHHWIVNKIISRHGGRFFVGKIV